MTNLPIARRVVRGIAQGAASTHFGLYFPTPQETETFVQKLLQGLIKTNPELLPTADEGNIEALLDAAAEGVDMRFDSDVRIVLAHKKGLRLHDIQPLL